MMSARQGQLHLLKRTARIQILTGIQSITALLLRSIRSKESGEGVSGAVLDLYDHSITRETGLTTLITMVLTYLLSALNHPRLNRAWKLQAQYLDRQNEEKTKTDICPSQIPSLPRAAFSMSCGACSIHASKSDLWCRVAMHMSCHSSRVEVFQIRDSLPSWLTRGYPEFDSYPWGHHTIAKAGGRYCPTCASENHGMDSKPQACACTQKLNLRTLPQR